MQLRADRVSLDGPHGTLLPSTSLAVADGELALVHGEPGTGVTALGLALAGRLRPTTGTVTVDEVADAAKLRSLVAVVDAPGVSEPDEALSLSVVVGEELALAGQPAAAADVRRWLTAHDLAPYAGTRFERIEPALRIRLLTELAATRAGVAALVLDRPDRHTSEVEDWAMVAHEHAERGLAVLVLTATAAVTALPAPPARIGQHDQPAPQRCRTETAETAEAGAAGDEGETP
ncbi:ATP-binding cassette domain-containing protein [Amycolatopsis aidingensis]|uniref:ABC transporter ATP-binding protein n=1 Tax=Amycolatopsis aidingensis TaxID=2842453 RepID=UPI001C0DFAB6|nr:ABC transporter ATP-binding protein [Amycolatopsis aidingensis]